VRVVARAAHDLGHRTVVADDLPAFDPSMAPADPSLEVIEMHGAGELRFRYQLTSQRLGLNHRFESPRITGDAVGYFGGFYARIEKEWKTANQNPRMFQRLLRALGVQLGEQLLPRDLRLKLWQLKGKLQGLQILSDETYIPWEMVHLKHPDEPLPRGESHFLGQLGLVRSMWESAPASKIVVRPGGARTLVPTYPSPRVALPQAQKERDWFAERFASTPLPATSEDVLDAFEVAGDFDLLHVACHGDLADRDAWLILEGSTRKGKWYPDKLSASLVAASADLGKGTDHRPMVFLNACKVARQEDLLSSACGWAPTLLRAGAGALIAPMWKVYFLYRNQIMMYRQAAGPIWIWPALALILP
ncbi:MAG: CHAT domain-containing protein, partial [Nannocystaceae bacterium]